MKEIVIRRSLIRVTKCCGSPFMLSPDMRCPACGQSDPELCTPYFSEDGNMMFALISDVTSARS